MRQNYIPPDDDTHRERCALGVKVRERLLEYQRRHEVAPELTREEEIALGELSAVTPGIPQLMLEWKAHDAWLADDETITLIAAQQFKTSWEEYWNEQDATSENASTGVD